MKKKEPRVFGEPGGIWGVFVLVDKMVFQYFWAICQVVLDRFAFFLNHASKCN